MHAMTTCVDIHKIFIYVLSESNDKCVLKLVNDSHTTLVSFGSFG